MVQMIHAKIVIFLITALIPGLDLHAKECVVLLHGLARTANSMNPLMERLEREKFIVVNIDYPSRDYTIDKLSNIAIEAGLKQCRAKATKTIHFVTHSLGGILVRYYMKKKTIPELKRVVMLGPPNQGSEVIDNLKDIPGFKFINGPAGSQLGTKISDVPKSLGAVNFELGVIAGTKSINLILSTFLPNPDDGKVSVVSTKVEGMSDFIELPTTHPFMMRNEEVINQIVHFIKYGRFEKKIP